MDGESEIDDLDTTFSDAMASQAAPDATPAAPDSSPPSSPEPAPVAPAAPSTDPELLAMARSAGLQFGETADAATLARMALENYQRSQPYVQYAQQIAPYADKFQQWLNEQNAPQQEAPKEEEWTPEGYFKQKWEAPEWNQQYNNAIQQRMVQKDPSTGLWVASQGFEVSAASMVAEMNRAQASQAQLWQDLARGNPYQKFHDVLMEPMRRAWKKDMEEFVQGQMGRQKALTAIEQYEQQNSHWLYQTDATGQRVPTAEGSRLISAIQKLSAFSDDPQERLTLALELTGIKPPAAQAPPATPQNPIAAANSAPANPGAKPLLDVALERASHAPSAQVGSLPTPPAQSVMLSEGELDSMFTQQLRAMKGH
jgi:hypothetical protein